MGQLELRTLQGTSILTSPPPARSLTAAAVPLACVQLAVIAATKVHARQYPQLRVNACCPGYCDTDMTSHRGPRPPSEGAQNAVLLATMPDAPTGAFFENLKPSTW